MKLTRHARNNAKLYVIEVDDISQAIAAPDRLEQQGGKHVAIKSFGKKYSGYPLKVVFDMAGDEPIIITAYPLKRKAWGGKGEG